MDPIIYKALHYIGIFTLLVSLGSIFTQYNKKAVIFHGIGLLFILVSGFGMAAKMGYGFPSWMIAKLVIWLAFGGIIVLAKKEKLSGPAAWVLCVVLAAVAMVLAMFRYQLGLA